jgi:uncharacterized membrane protein YccC
MVVAQGRWRPLAKRIAADDEEARVARGQSGRALPGWFAHALVWHREPVPWGAVVRGALGAGPLLAVGVAAGSPSAGVILALGAMLATVNDRQGSRTSAVPRMGLPALAGALGMLAGTPLAGLPEVLLVLTVTAVALPAGAFSAIGPVSSSASTQFLITTVVAAGMGLPQPAWQRAALFLGGAAWLLATRLLLPSRPARLDFLDGEREAVAAAYEAVADLLLAAGGPHALRQRAQLTAALDRAQDALSGPRPRQGAAATADRRLRARFAAVLPLAEAATALTWAGTTTGERSSHGPRRLATAVRADTAAGPLPAPVRDHPALRALDDALLSAAEAFALPTEPANPPHRPQPPDRPAAPAHPAQPVQPGEAGEAGQPGRPGEAGDATAVTVQPVQPVQPVRSVEPVHAAESANSLAREGQLTQPDSAGTGRPSRPASAAPAVAWGQAVRSGPGAGRANAGERSPEDGVRRRRVEAGVAGLRRMVGPAGREYGVRIAAAVGASAAAAQALHPQHWYWLPTTAVFLVKPDLGPLASRIANRALGTTVGALLFAAVAALGGLAGTGWPYPLVVVCAALLPAAARHFAAQTCAVTMLVLAFVTVGGDAGAYLDRVTDTLLACAIVLVVGHLPLPGRAGGDIGVRLADAAAATERYVGHVLDHPADTERRFALRRAAYRALAGARTAAELAAAELPPLARHSAGATREVAELEHLVDTATATAVRLDHAGAAEARTESAAARAALRRLAGSRGTPARSGTSA